MITKIPDDITNTKQLVKYLNKIIEPRGLRLTIYNGGRGASRFSAFYNSIIVLHRGDEFKTLSTCCTDVPHQITRSIDEIKQDQFHYHMDKVESIDFETLDFDEYHEYAHLFKKDLDN